MKTTLVRLCTINGCPRKYHARGMCVTHIARMRRSGTTDAPWLTPADRFWSKVTKTGTCWLFAPVAQNGYGRFRVDGMTKISHRYAYEISVGPIPEGLTIDHLCRVRACVNPAHLEAVTQWENTMRAPETLGAINAAKTECLRGHPFSDENTYYSRDGRRHCRECARTYEQRKKARIT